MTTCHCPQCTTNPLPTYTEAYREATESRYVARLPSDQYRTAYLSDVAVKRGSMAAQRLRRLAFEVMMDNVRAEPPP